MKEGKVDLYAMHKKMTGHLFPAYSSEDERFLSLALCGETAELLDLAVKLVISAGMIGNKVKKRWRDGADLTEEIKDEIADCRVYLELIAKCFDIEGEKLDQRVVEKLRIVAERHGIK